MTGYPLPVRRYPTPILSVAAVEIMAAPYSRLTRQGMSTAAVMVAGLATNRCEEYDTLQLCFKKLTDVVTPFAH